jgi:hypothetical protein
MEGKGYIGKQMSRNALAAYVKGQKPLSKWTKKEILSSISEIFEYNEKEPEVDFGKLRLQELKDSFLRYTAWHHTGALYNTTNFYEISEALILNFTKEDFVKIVEKRKPRKKSVKNPDADFEKIVSEKADDAFLKLNVVYNSQVLKLKTLDGVVKRFAEGKMDLESTFNSAVEKIIKNDKWKIEQWTNLPNTHWRWEYVYLFVKEPSKYAIKCYGGVVNRRTSIYKKIKDKVSEERQ